MHPNLPLLNFVQRSEKLLTVKDILEFEADDDLAFDQLDKEGVCAF